VSSGAGPEPWVVLLAARDQRPLDEASFVLRAIGIDYALSRLDGAWQLSVPATSAARAAEELAAYRAEIAHGPRQGAVPLPELESGWTGVAAYAAVLLIVAVAANQDLLGHDWRAIGRLDVDRVLAGEWWRTVTALCLHVDTAHLAGNLAFGGFFGLYAGRYLGSGIAWLAILAGGVIGNALNALIQPTGHLAVGASTAVFAALGLLAAYTWRRGFLRQTGWKTRVAPLTAALGLLAFLGTGGGGASGDVDIIAHLTGFIAGLAIGALLAAGEPSRLTRLGRAAAGAAAAVVVAAWLWGFAAG
jgi:membrane associated rhomboid family serine protease